jgi:hypothetical protein
MGVTVVGKIRQRKHGFDDAVSSFNKNFSPWMREALAMKRALIASGQLGLEEEPVMKEQLGEGMVKRGGKVFRSSQPYAGVPGAEVLGDEVPSSEYMKQVGTRQVMKPTGYNPGAYKQAMMENTLSNQKSNRAATMERIAMQYAQNMADKGMIKDPEVFNKTYLAKLKQLNTLDALTGSAGGIAGMGGESIDTTAAPAGEGMTEAVDLSGDVEAIKAMSPEQQQQILDSLDQAYDPDEAEYIRSQIQAGDETIPPEEVPGPSLLPSAAAAPGVPGTGISPRVSGMVNPGYSPDYGRGQYGSPSTILEWILRGAKMRQGRGY